MGAQRKGRLSMLAQYGGPEDILAIVRYLKPKPTGATQTEARKTLGNAIVDARKVAALQAWNVIQVNNDRMTLTAPGREVAHDESKISALIADALRAEPAYKGALEWAHYQNRERLDAHELGAYWHQHYASALGTSVDKAISRSCSAFFRLVEGAGLGTYVLGRRGSASRIDFDRAALQAFVEHSPIQLPTQVPETGEQEGEGDGIDGENRSDEEIVMAALGDRQTLAQADKTLRVFISHGKNKELVEQVSTILDLADIAYEIAVEEETTAIPVPEKVLSSMRRCSAGIIIVSVDDPTAASLMVNENVLIETGAAFVLYDRRVVLVWDKRLPVPSNLQGLYRCEFEGDELGWGEGVKLMKTLRNFKTI